MIQDLLCNLAKNGNYKAIRMLISVNDFANIDPKNNSKNLGLFFNVLIKDQELNKITDSQFLKSVEALYCKISDYSFSKDVKSNNSPIDFNFKNNEGDTLLHIAIKSAVKAKRPGDHYKLISTLYSNNKVNIDILNNEGKKATFYAADNVLCKVMLRQMKIISDEKTNPSIAKSI